MAGDSKTSAELMVLYRSVMAAVVVSGVDVVLFFGTLLGIVREGGFIEGDDDVDVLIYHTDLPRLRHVVDGTIGLRGVTLGEFPRQIYQIFVGRVGPFDVYPYYLINDKRDILVAWEAKIYDALDVFPARSIRIGGYPVLVPKNPHRILRDTYGSRYMTPLSKGEYIEGEAVRICDDIPRAVESSLSLARSDTSSAVSSIVLLLVTAAVALCVIFTGIKLKIRTRGS